MDSDCTLSPSGSSVPHSPNLDDSKDDRKNFWKPKQSNYVKLNVGGTLFHTTVTTLTKHDSMLRAMFSGRNETETDDEGWVLIDRCGKHFGTILNFLRDDQVNKPESLKETKDLLIESRYYCLTELENQCERWIQDWNKESNTCMVPLISSEKEEQKLIQTTSKPIVKLLVNRHNNKYSYTSTSDDNLLKNVELFDRLSLRFSRRVLFMKDVIGSNEICLWSFYGHGKLLGEVCCTSIVYATDRKHTKVEFPEARIYEETLNALLYENRNIPDCDLIKATSLGCAGSSITRTSDDEEPSTCNNDQPAGFSMFRGGLASCSGHSSGMSKFRGNKNT